MTAAIVVTFVFALIIGGLFGNVSASMTKPMSDAFRIWGTLWSGCAGLVVALIGLFFGVSAWSFLLCGIIGLVIGGAAVEFERWRKG